MESLKIPRTVRNITYASTCKLIIMHAKVRRYKMYCHHQHFTGNKKFNLSIQFHTISVKHYYDPATTKCILNQTQTDICIKKGFLTQNKTTTTTMSPLSLLSNAVDVIST